MSAREIRQELLTFETAYRDATDPIARVAFAARICALQDVLGEDEIGPKRLAEYTSAEIASVIWPA